jgi:hypothetical protein
MEPKFQSSFIPKGPIATTGTATRISREAGRSVLGTLAVFIFTFAILLSLGVFGYEFYLKANISKMTGNLATARASLEPETIKQISDLDSRIISTRDLLESHIVLSPLFDYLENSTLKGVRFTQFQYQTTEKGLELSMRGQARGYSAVALQSDIFNKGQYFDEPIFADLDLDERGNVTFSFRALVDPSIVSYQKEITASSIDEPVSAIVTPTGTSVSTSSPQATPQ